MNASQLPSHQWLSESELVFDPVNEDARHIHPLQGLIEFGPYSQVLMADTFRPIRVAFIVPNGMKMHAGQLLREFQEPAKPDERKNYLPDFPGFESVFRTKIEVAPKGIHVELDASLDDRIQAASEPHSILASELSTQLAHLQSNRSQFDVVFILLSKSWKRAFRSEEADGFDLHHYLKAMSATRGVPIQLLNEDRVFDYACRCSVAWRLAIALYAKAGGIPWKVAGADPNTAHVGISYAMRKTSTGQQFTSCCSQVFSADGTGLEFLAFDVDGVEYVSRSNPFLTRAEMRRVMARTMSLYQRQHAGQLPARLVVHKSTHFTAQEVDGCFDACGSVKDIELIQVQRDTAWRGVQINRDASNPKKGIPARYPCKRGSFLQIDDRATLLWTQGNVPMPGGRDYFKEGKGIPSPLLLQRFAGHGPFDRVCREILGLTKMNWNNDGLYDQLPVTLHYANLLAQTLSKMSRLDNRPYQFRFFI